MGDEAARERVCRDAINMVSSPSEYHMLLNNCEHNTNKIYKGQASSPNVHFVTWALIRQLLCTMGLVFLGFFASECAVTAAVDIAPPLAGGMASLGFYLFAVLPA